MLMIVMNNGLATTNPTLFIMFEAFDDDHDDDDDDADPMMK